MEKIDFHKSRWFDPRLALAIALAACVYALLHFVVYGLPFAGIPTFRIDYHVVSSRRGDDFDDLVWAIMYTRPVAALYLALQSFIANVFMGGDSRYLAYGLQHVALFIGFFSTAKAIESIFRVRMSVVMLLSAWLVFAITPAVMEGVYKLETVVGTLAMLFGGVSVLFLVRWQENRSGWFSAGFLLFYALALFSKEDFILPPLFLLAWYMFRGGFRQGLSWRNAWLLVAAIGLVAFFVVFNKAVTHSDRSFISAVNSTSSPYYMTLNPISLFKTAMHYCFGFDPAIRIIFLAYMVASILAIVFRKSWKEIILVGLIVGGLMGPYLIMPNHLYSYYGLKWMMWQVLTTTVIVQLFVTNRRLADLVVACLSVAFAFPVISGFLKQQNQAWYGSRYLKHEFAVSGNMRDTLRGNRRALNALDRVAVIGVGPGQIANSPWQGNGETAFYLTDDLGLVPNWVVYVRSSREDYAVEPPVSLSDAPKHVAVRDIRDLENTSESHALVFDRTGLGRLISLEGVDLDAMVDEATGVRRHDVWLASPDLKMSANPQAIPVCTSKPEAVEIAWDARALASDRQVQIWVVDPTGGRKLWLQGSAMGSAKTGPWVKGGARFELEDVLTQEKLSSITIGASACR